MTSPTKTERLLDDTLSEAASIDFSHGVLERTLRQVRRRRRVRQVRQTLLTLAVLAALTFWLWPREHSVPAQATKQSRPVSPVMPAITLVQTLPLPPSMVVETHPGSISMLPVATSTITLVETLPADELFRQLDDNQLLALVTGKPVALVRYGPHNAVLAMPEELLQEGFRVE
jgi:hypothetical protein